MKLVTYQYHNQSKIGAVHPDGIVDLSTVAPDMLSLIDFGGSGLEEAQSRLNEAATILPVADVKLLAPIPVPRRNIICLGWNYVEHVQESSTTRGQQTELPEFPVIFTKATTTVNGPYDAIPFDASVSQDVDWEVELAVIIGRAGKNISPEAAMSHIFGYTVINDVSARDLQWQHKQFFKGKSLDGTCPMGPWIVTADSLPNPQALNITSRVNGIIKQQSHTSLMIFDIAATITHLSRGMTLLAGDIIATGTPGGVGFARQPPEFLRPGDVVECEVEGVGLIRNHITAVD